LLGGLAAVIVIGAAAFFLWPRSDDKASLDRQIEEDWMAGRDVVDAVKFFESGGVYENRGGEGSADIDQKYVIPLIKRLRDEHGLTVLVVKLQKAPNTAGAVIAQVPQDRVARNRVRATILESAQDFPGLVTQYWSHRWMSLDFLDELEMQQIPPKILQKLRDGQRRMD
jgi:hypothetical protein